jgi:hypothetical protein
MDGLLDFAKSPEGQGLLAAAFGGLAGARRGAPVNTLGIAGLAGLTGYSNAQQRDSTEQYRNMQAKHIQAELDKQAMATKFAKLFMPDSAPQGATPAPDGSAMASAAPNASPPIQAGSQGQAMPQGQPSQQMPAQGPQGAFPMSMNGVAAYNMLDMPNGPALLEMWKQANNPQERKAGNYYVDPRTGQQTYMPKLGEGTTMGSNGQAMQVQGAAQANAGYKGLEAGSVAAAQLPSAIAQKATEQTGAAALDPIKVIGPDGTEQWMPRLNVARSGQGGVPGQPGGGFVAGRNPVTQSSSMDLNKNWITNTYQPTLDSGKTATDMSTSISAMRNINPSTGWGSDAKATAANFLTGIGVAPKNVELYAANAQKMQSVAMDRLLSVLGAQKGMQTEGDADRASKTFVSLKNTPEANDFILDLAQAKANQDARKAQFYEQALPLAQKEGDLTKVDREWRKIQGSIWGDPTLSRWQKK